MNQTLSETSFASINQAKIWLQNQTATTLNPVQAKAKQLREDMEEAMQNLNEASKMLSDVSQREIDKRNMRVYNRARALNKIAQTFVDRLKKLETPQIISYDSISSYVQETQKIIQVTDVDIRNWFPRISPFFIMVRLQLFQVFDRT